MRGCTGWLIVLLLCGAAALSAETAAPPRIRACETSRPPAIDGVLDDVCWAGCARITGFVSMARGGPAQEQTEAMLCADARNLYVAFICQDSQPSRIHADQKQRNYDLAGDDWVEILIDSMNNDLEHYHFTVNPIGTQMHKLPVGAAANITWRGDWQAAAKIVDGGWQAEMAIPFGGLRFPNGANCFGILFRRYCPRIDETSVWPDVGLVMNQTRFADLVDLKLPPPRSRPVLMPFMVTSTEPGRSFTQIGFDFKEELPGNITALGTYNPDFTDVQDAVASLSYSYTERYLPEQRPFFQEGSAHFSDSLAFYSRRIGAIDWGAKVFGHPRGHAFALLGALNRGRDSHFATQYVRDIDEDTAIGAYFTGSDVKDPYKLDPAEPDSSFCFSPVAWKQWRSASGTTGLSLRYYRAINSGMPSGSALRARFSRTAAPGYLGYSLSYEDTDSNYYVRDAYIPLTGVRGFYSRLSYSDRPANSKITYWDAYVTGRRRWAEAGGVHDEDLGCGGSVQTRNEWSFVTWLNKGTWEGLADSTATLQVGWLTRRLYGGGAIGCSIGKRAGEDYRYVWCDQNIRLTRNISLTCGYEWTRLGGPAGGTDSQFTVLGNYEMSSERCVGLWMVGRDADVNLCLTYKQTVRSGSDIYLIFGYPNTQTTQQRIALKIVHPIAW